MVVYNALFMIEYRKSYDRIQGVTLGVILHGVLLLVMSQGRKMRTWVICIGEIFC